MASAPQGVGSLIVPRDEAHFVAAVINSGIELLRLADLVWDSRLSIEGTPSPAPASGTASRPSGLALRRHCVSASIGSALISPTARRS